MSIMEMASKAQELQQLKRMREELDAEITAAEDAIKAAMGDQETVTAGAYKISYKPVISSRIDTTALKKALPEIAAQYMRTTTTRRFTIC